MAEVNWNFQLAEQWAQAPMAELVLHINREMLHHGAEVALLRDLYLWHYDGWHDDGGATPR